MTTLADWVQSLELGEQSPVPIISYYNDLLNRVRRTNDEIQIIELEETENTSDVPLAGAALRGLHCVAPAQRATGSEVIETDTHQLEDTMAKKSTVREHINIQVSTVGSALLHHLDPVIAKLDEFAPNESGHELPSRKDGMLRILVGNFCRDVYQQIYGVNTENYKFDGVKTNWDRAQNAVAQLVRRYQNAPEDMEADPNCAKFMAWYETSQAKYDALNGLLNDLTDVYRSVTGTDWEYKAPGTGSTKVHTNIDPQAAAKKLRQIAEAKKAQSQLSEQSVLISRSA